MTPAFLRYQYIADFNRRFAVPAEQPATAFVRCHGKDLDWVFSLQQARTVNRDNTVADNHVLHIEKSRWRNTPAGCPSRWYQSNCRASCTCCIPKKSNV